VNFQLLIYFHVYFLGYLSYIINMGQTKSKDCADKKGTDNLSAQVAVSEIETLRRLAENEGPTQCLNTSIIP
jgi:hypothetical protein